MMCHTIIHNCSLPSQLSVYATPVLVPKCDPCHKHCKLIHNLQSQWTTHTTQCSYNQPTHTAEHACTPRIDLDLYGTSML